MEEALQNRLLQLHYDLGNFHQTNIWLCVLNAGLSLLRQLQGTLQKIPPAGFFSDPFVSVMNFNSYPFFSRLS